MTRISSLAYLGPQVELGTDVAVGPGAVILGPCVIEDRVYIGPGAQIGAAPEISSLEQVPSWAETPQGCGVRIKTGAVIKENAVIHQGSYRETTVGKHSWVLNRAYLAHDVLVGEASTLSAGVSVGGHCEIHDRVNIGMNAVIHQRVKIAAGAMVGMGTPLTRDVPPFAKVYGTPPRINGVNAVGLDRAGLDPTLAQKLEQYYANEDVFFASDSLTGEWEQLNIFIQWWRSHPHLNPVKTARR